MRAAPQDGKVSRKWMLYRDGWCKRFMGSLKALVLRHLLRTPEMSAKSLYLRG